MAGPWSLGRAWRHKDAVKDRGPAPCYRIVTASSIGSDRIM